MRTVRRTDRRADRLTDRRADRLSVRPRTPTRALVLGLCALLGSALVGCTAGDAARGPVGERVPEFTHPPLTPAANSLLIKHGWDVPTPESVRENAERIDALPFDGITVALPDELSARVQSQTPVSGEELAAAMAPLAAAELTEVDHNFVMVYSAPAGDLFDDWAVPLQNFEHLAREARIAGFAGVFYDIEEYFGDALRFPENCTDRPLPECRAQAQVRGEQVTDAIRAGWPEARVLTTFGPWLSDPATEANLPGVTYSDVAWANELSGSFVVGLVAGAAGTDVTVIDGGEIYTPRDRAQFETVKVWLKYGMPSSSPLIPDELRADWPDEVSVAFGVYDQPWHGVDMDVELWETTLRNALTVTDEYVWAYTERHDWLGTGWPEEPVPADWVAATRAARAAAP